MQYVRTERSEGVAVLTVDRQEALNAVNHAVLQDLATAFDELLRDPSVRVAILTGAGDRAFIAGGDIAAMLRMSVWEVEAVRSEAHALCARLDGGRIVTIAAINGYALGGGLELALACDLRVASESAVLGLPEVSIGLIPGWGGSQRLARLVGRGKAKELVLTAERIPAEEAHRIGLVNRVVPREELLPTCHAIAKKVLRNAPIAVEQAKKSISGGIEMPLGQALAYDSELASFNFAREDRKEGLRAFLEKRRPEFRGHHSAFVEAPAPPEGERS